MKKKAIQSTQSDDDSNDSNDEEDLVTYDDVSKQTNGDVYESNIKGASLFKILYIASYKEDTNSHLDTTM